MKRYVFFVAILLVVFVATVIIGRLYPVVSVNGSLIWYRTWNRYLQGIGHALAIQARASSSKFDLDIAVASAIKKDTLATLVEDRILAEAGSQIIPQFDARAAHRVSEAIATSTNLGKAAQFMYGFSQADFNRFILLPESRREIVRDELEKQGINFEAWFANVKKKTHVQIFMNRYVWDGDRVIEKQ